MLDERTETVSDASSEAMRERLIRIQDGIRQFVYEECRAQKEHYHCLWKRPLLDRVRSGRALTGLRLESIREERILHFKCDENDGDFREGDRVRISHGDPLDAICNGELYREEIDFIQVTLDRPGDWQPREHNAVFTLDHSYFDLEKYYVRAVEALDESEVGRERILPLLAGFREPSCDF